MLFQCHCWFIIYKHKALTSVFPLCPQWLFSCNVNKTAISSYLLQSITLVTTPLRTEIVGMHSCEAHHENADCRSSPSWLSIPSPTIDTGDCTFTWIGDRLSPWITKCWLYIPPPPPLDQHRWSLLHMDRQSPFHMDCKMLLSIPSPPLNKMSIRPRLTQKLLSHFDHAFATLNSLIVCFAFMMWLRPQVLYCWITFHFKGFQSVVIGRKIKIKIKIELGTQQFVLLSKKFFVSDTQCNFRRKM